MALVGGSAIPQNIISIFLVFSIKVFAELFFVNGGH
jgi:hypothetical protein